MANDADLLIEGISPLEAFLRDYAEVSGGLWDEVEPQVYDLMLPNREPEVVRVAFDPEALPEHPGAQIASFGTPLVDRLLADAVERGRHARLYFTGLGTSAQGVASRVARALTVPEGSSLRIDQARAMHFPQAVSWFQATFISDQKEQDLLPVAIDLHHGRQVRHLDRLLDRAHLAEEPWTPLPEARHAGLAAAYPIARDRVVRTLAALANTRARELGERLNRQVERMRKYYADLREEVEEQAERARNRSEDEAKFASRREALDREEQSFPHCRAPPEGRAQGPSPLEQLAGDPPAQVVVELLDLNAWRDGNAAGASLGSAGREFGGSPLPELRPADVRARSQPARDARLPRLRGEGRAYRQARPALSEARLARRSGENPQNRPPVRDDRQRALKLIMQLQIGGDAETSVDRGDDLGGSHRVALRSRSDLIAGAVDVTLPDSAACQKQGVTEVPVVATRGPVDLGAASKLAHHDDERPLEPAAGAEIVEQAGDGSIKLREQRVLERSEVVSVRVPCRVRVGGPGDVHDARARLNQAASKEDTLTVDVSAVAVAGA